MRRAWSVGRAQFRRRACGRTAIRQDARTASQGVHVATGRLERDELANQREHGVASRLGRLNEREHGFYNIGVVPLTRAFTSLLLLSVLVMSAAAQSTTPPPAQTPVPRPSPFPGAKPPAPTTSPAPATVKDPQTNATKPVSPPPQSGVPQDGSTIDPRLAGVPIYAGAELLSSFDAGRGQHIFLFGSNMPYSDVVAFYKTQLRTSGSEIWRAPATYQFDWGQYRSDVMTYRPSVVVKDHTWNNSPGYLHVAGTTEKRYRTVIQVVK
jgi:hypothetical protein